MPAIRKWFDFVPNTTGLVRGDQRKFGKVMSAYLKSFAATAILPFELAYPQSHRLYGEAIHRFVDSLREDDSLQSTTDRAPTNPSLDDCTHPATRMVLADLLQSQLPPISELMNDGQYRLPKDYPLQRILHFTAPLALLDAAVTYNLKKSDAGVRQLYVAQAPLNDLPKELQDDLPVPRIVKTAGKGDIYDSSVWLGLEPTYTPLHRDPNPNLFIQLCGNKVVRLLPPASGGQIFRDVQLRLNNNFANSRLRGPEMMSGPERELMYGAVWYEDGLRGTQAPQGAVEEYQDPSRSKMQEARLQPGDALFIPKGWWHSVKSEDDAGRLNASVNWWFR
ncbi:hypothetical protein N0V82_000936 [Gnomoniopsis sp. IMI 355080]|nr:hypothetical protein N0V82_000936 [Gnomoniopsis sp. IMI 355080]